jgi:alpha,alpha-trehalose phosphorylase
MPEPESDPRGGTSLSRPLRGEQYSNRDTGAVLVHVTEHSKLRVAAGMDHIVAGPPATGAASESSEDVARVTITADLAQGQRLRVLKLLAYA